MAAGRSVYVLHLICGLPKSTPTSSCSSRLLYCRLGKVIKQLRTQSEGRGSSQWSFGSCHIRCMSGETSVEGQRRMPARLVQKQQFLEARETDISEANVPIPKVALDHVTLNYARSGGPGGQNVNKVNTKVDMRFKVMDAHWLPERIRLKLLQMEKNRVNNDGELVISSTKTRTQKGNVEDALSKLQSMIDAAAYVPPPPSAETKSKIQKLARVENEKRLTQKKQASVKKSIRRNKGSWD